MDSKTALDGFRTRGPVGALVGGGMSLVGGLFGKSKQKKEVEEAKRDAENRKALEASRAWISNLPQFDDLRFPPSSGEHIVPLQFGGKNEAYRHVARLRRPCRLPNRVY